ncbi:hypothetical protein HHI36_002734 [Cryptolaemus montrouzieri]|uniref:5-formyltetrahydrofolate cyclo-ligase n=1 Tax=Cryptolaemus montrouzieri TaxID=559131 RepID=A0ABD2PBE2_9CUCU
MTLNNQKVNGGRAISSCFAESCKNYYNDTKTILYLQFEHVDSKEFEDRIAKTDSPKISNLSSEEKKTQSEFVSDKLFQLPIFQESKRISVYLSTENEIDTKPIVAKIFENGQNCFVPR